MEQNWLEVLKQKVSFAENIYPQVLQLLVDYENLVDTIGDREEKHFQKLEQDLSLACGESICGDDYVLWETWEANGIEREAYRVALGSAPILSLSREDYREILHCILESEIPENCQTSFVQGNGFDFEIVDWMRLLIQKNCPHYQPNWFNRQKVKGKWVNPSVDGILDRYFN